MQQPVESIISPESVRTLACTNDFHAEGLYCDPRPGCQRAGKRVGPAKWYLITRDSYDRRGSPLSRIALTRPNIQTTRRCTLPNPNATHTHCANIKYTNSFRTGEIVCHSCVKRGKYFPWQFVKQPLVLFHRSTFNISPSASAGKWDTGKHDLHTH